MSTLQKKNTRKSPSLRQQDPHLEREKLKYDHPLPSREYILAILAEQGVPLYADELASMLAIKKDERRYFERRLTAMSHDGQIVINRKGAICVAGKLDLIKCRIQGHRDGYGFAIPEDGSDDLFLPEREMRKVLNGDLVMVSAGGTDRRGRREGRIAEILQRVVERLVARVYHERGVWIAIAEDKRISQDVLIEPGGQGQAKEGQVVMVQILSQPDAGRQPIGRVVEVLGEYADPGMEIEIALRKHALPYCFDDAAVEQAKKTPKKVLKKDLKGRVDLTDLPLVTIDGETARDFDDAVYAEKVGRGYRLIVAIADVSHYAQLGDALDTEAYARGTSVYFPRRVIPMLPEVLSNGICSLNPDVERLCMVCDMQINQQGVVKQYTFYPAVIRSHARLTYNQVWEWIEQGVDHPYKVQIDDLYMLFKKLLAAREKRGAIDFDTVETQMQFNEDGKIERIVPIVRNDAHRLIEECMLAANVCAAEFISQHKHPCLYRVHEGPTLEKLENLRTTLRLVGLTLGGGEKPTTKDYAHLAEKIQGRPDASVLEMALLRSLQQAVYTPDNQGHFGLAYAAYTHFTSPIRRYPDLMVHRTIKAILNGERFKPGKWQKIGEHCSMTERRADDASRDVEAWLKTYYMRDKVGQIFTGKISAVTNFGLFVMLDDVYVEGLVHISELGKDYFHYRPEILSIVGERSGLQFRMGDALTVKVAAANLDNSKVDFVLVNNDPLQEPSATKVSTARNGVANRKAKVSGTRRAASVAKKQKDKKNPKSP